MDDIKTKLKSGEMVFFLGMGIFKDTLSTKEEQLPYDSDSLILALNNGRAMSPRLMYEYSRAAMSLEQRKGREYITQMTNHIFSSKEYEPPKIYSLIASIKPKYVIDTNMDDSLLKAYEDVEHFLIVGTSRIMATDTRYIIYKYTAENKSYEQRQESDFHTDIPVLFKPMGSTKPVMNFIVSDADFVDWLTEAMGGYAMPKALKEYRKDKEYLFMGIDFSRDTFRMVANEITLELKGGIVLSEKKELGKKEKQWIENHNLTTLRASQKKFTKALT